MAGVMRAVRRCNATGAFSWIGSDGWSARGLVSNGNEPEVEGTLSVQPQANPVKGFEEYFLNLTVENNRRNPWFVGKRTRRDTRGLRQTSPILPTSASCVNVRLLRDPSNNDKGRLVRAKSPS